MVENPIKQTNLNTSACGDERNIFDSDGRYIKTACAVFSETTYSEACIDFGMSLYTVDSERAEAQVLTFSTIMFGSDGGSMLWINGKKDRDGKWYAYNQGNKTLVNFTNQNNIVPSQKYFSPEKFLINSTLEENCLTVNAQKSFKIRPFVCNWMMYAICEYVKSNSSSLLQPSKT